MQTKYVILGALVVVGLAGLAAADPGEYVQGNVGVGVSLSVTECAPDGVGGPGTPSFGGVRFCAGHISPDLTGQATVSIADDVVNPSSAVYCQDLNANSLCGEQDVISGLRVEPRLHFCAAFTLSTPIDLTPRASWDTNNWDPASDVLVFNDSPGTGNPTNSPCGLTYSGATHGFVNHS